MIYIADTFRDEEGKRDPNGFVWLKCYWDLSNPPDEYIRLFNIDAIGAIDDQCVPLLGQCEPNVGIVDLIWGHRIFLAPGEKDKLLKRLYEP